MTEDFPIRLGTLDDVETVVAHRRAMFREMGYRDEQALDTMCEAFRPWLERKMQTGEYLAWLAVDAGGAIAAGVGLWLMDWPPSLIGTGPWRGNILNVYTRPESRRMGLARKLIDAALAWCLLRGIRAVILHASDDGRRLYESLGFEPTNEMRISLNRRLAGSLSHVARTLVFAASRLFSTLGWQLGSLGGNQNDRIFARQACEMRFAIC